MFINNKYTRWYFNIVEKYAIQTDIEKVYTEVHHIIPKALGGDNSKQNLITVSARVHFLLHLLLLKMCDNPKHRRSMSFALLTMRRSNSKERYKYISSKLFERYKIIIGNEMKGENNPMYGKGHLFTGENNPMYGKPCYYKMTKEQKEQWRNNISKGVTGEKNPFYGKKHSEEIRKHISECRSKYITVIFNNNDIQHFRGYEALGIFLGKSGALGAKLCKDQYKNFWEKYNIKDIEKYENKEDQISKYGKSI